MAKCTACGKFLSPTGAATCTLCPLKFHKGCVSIADCSTVPSDWACPECRKKCRKGDNSNTPVKSVSGAPALPPSIETDEALLNRLPTIASSSAEDTDVRSMRRELAEYMAEQREFRMELRASIASIVERVDKFERRLEAVESREAMAITTNEDVAELQRTVGQLKLELNDREQENLLSDLDIGHMPEQKNENVLHSITIMAAKLGVTLEHQDIVFAERVGALEASGTGGESGTGGRPRRVVVRLARRRLRDELISAARVRRNLTSVDFGLAGPPRRVYVNERLTRTNRQLFHRVREECRKRQWRYSWTKNGRIYARQGDGKKAFYVRSDAELCRVFGPDTV